MELNTVSDKRLQLLDQLLEELRLTFDRAGLQATPEAESFHQFALQVSEARRERFDAIALEPVPEMTALVTPALTFTLGING